MTAQRRDHGELQSEILRIVLRRGSCTVRDVLHELSEQRSVAYTTILTVMSRLAERGVLHRELRGKVGVFSTARSEDRHAAGQVVDQFLGRFGAIGVNEFVMRAKSEPELFSALSQLVKEQDDAPQ